MAKASDNVFPYVHVAPAAAPASPSAGSQRLYLDSADGNKLKRKDSSGTVTTIEGAAGGTYSTYTPVLTGVTTNPNLGTGGSVSGRYTQVGKLVTGNILVTFGTTGVSAGSGAYLITLPVTAATNHAFAMLGPAYWTGGGAVAVGFATRYAPSSGTQLQLLGTTGTAIGSTNAFTTNDVIIIEFTYEAA